MYRTIGQVRRGRGPQNAPKAIPFNDRAGGATADQS
jgi:hypothetical protein